MTFPAIPSPARALPLLALLLSACAPDRVVTGSTYPHDVRERHPIILANAPETLDIFPAAGGLGERQREDLGAFVAAYLEHGQGAVTVSIPADPVAGAAGRRVVSALKATLTEAGAPSRSVVVASYPVVDPGLAAPIRLSFRRLQAKVGSRCGLWPQDLGVSNGKASANNQPYWNHGCAIQSNLAAQVADPLDLVRPRPEGRADTIRRAANIEKLRKGEDPSTEYRTPKDRINQTFGE